MGVRRETLSVQPLLQREYVLIDALGTPGVLTLPSQGNVGPLQVSLTPAGGGLGAARPWGRSEAPGLVLFVRGCEESGSDNRPARHDEFVANAMHAHGVGTLLLDLSIGTVSDTRAATATAVTGTRGASAQNSS